MPRGIVMETFDEFEAKTMLAFDLQPQEGEIAFLPGKGWGTEIAIQYPVYKKTADGYVKRKKDPACFKKRGYRSHSDMELYGMLNAAKDNGPLYTPEFHEKFGSQEVFQATKVANAMGVNVPTREELWDNTEITILPNGRQIKTMSLEYLLLEKLMEYPNFDKPNNHGRNISDAGALALVYEDIDREKVKELYKRYLDLKTQKILRDVPDVISYVTAPRSGGRSSRYETVVRNMEKISHLQYDPLIFGSFVGGVSASGEPGPGPTFLRAEDCVPIMQIFNDPASWKEQKLTESAKEAVRESMIKSTQESLRIKLEEIGQSMKKIDKFFSDVDRRKKEIREETSEKKSKKTRDTSPEKSLKLSLSGQSLFPKSE